MLLEDSVTLAEEELSIEELSTKEDELSSIDDEEGPSTDEDDELSSEEGELAFSREELDMFSKSVQHWSAPELESSPQANMVVVRAAAMSVLAMKLIFFITNPFV